MQLSLIFPASIHIPRQMPAMHINMVRHRINNGELKLLSHSRLDTGLQRFRWTDTGKEELIEVTKTVNLKIQ